MYSQVRNCVRVFSNVSDFGYITWRTFILFVNDMHSKLAKIDDTVKLLENISLFMLMYADDIILSRTEEPAKAGTCARDRRALQ